MLPTRPRALARSMCSSCTTACSSIATRVSCGVTLMRISWLIGNGGKSAACYSWQMVADLRQDPGGFKQGQAHDARVTAVEMADECRRPALDAVATGLVEGLARGHVALDVVPREHAEGHVRRRDGKLDLRLPPHGHSGEYDVRIARQALKHGGRGGRIPGLAQHHAVDDDFSVGSEHRLRR